VDKKQLLLANMHTFSVAARLLSFTKAADELCITQGAVSHRIKVLEKQLGFSLFVRMTRRLELTAEGERLLQALTSSFDVIFSEIEDIKFNELRGELYIGAAPTFAQSWLLPKLPSFQSQYPNLNLKLRVKASRLDFQHEPVDLAIYYSDGNHPELYSQRLFDEYLTPVCSPTYYQQHFKGQAFEFAQATFIHCSESLESSEPNSEWQRWLKGQALVNGGAEQSSKGQALEGEGWEDLDVLTRVYVFNHSDMAMSAAKNGMGIAMARVSLVEKALQEGELVAPFARVFSGRGYDLVCPKGQQNRPRYRAFVRWLEAQLENKQAQEND